MINLVISLLLSGAFGYIAARLMNVEGQWYLYVILGLLGGVVGDVLFSLVGFSSHSLLSSAIVSVIGACVVVILYRKLSK